MGNRIILRMRGGNKRTKANKQLQGKEAHHPRRSSVLYRNSRPDRWVSTNSNSCISITVPHLIGGLLVPRGSLLAKLLREERKTSEVQERDNLCKKKRRSVKTIHVEA